MVFLVNLVFAALAFFLTRYMFLEVGAKKPVAVAAGLVMGLVVFLLNLAQYFV